MMNLDPYDAIHAEKHRLEFETYDESKARIANALKDDDEHFREYYNITRARRFLEGGRIQAAAGSPRKVTMYNCFVSMTIPDSMEGITTALAEAAQTMRLGGGIGYDFSTLRPKRALISTLGSTSSGPLSFMNVFDAMCKTIMSAGLRRGAMMATMRVDHPDIEEFIHAKNNKTELTQFNMSVMVTDKFMEAVKKGDMFDLVFGETVYKRVDAGLLWESILRSTWDWAEPGILFIDRINRKNNLWYCEQIAATNPCGEQPLPPYGACLLGSLNLVRYVVDGVFNYDLLIQDIPHIVRAMDNVIDRSIYPLEMQKIDAQNKRRMGIGITGLANAGEIMGMPYASDKFIEFQKDVQTIIRDECYKSSIELAKEKGSFPLFDAEKYLQSEFALSLPDYICEGIREHGIRNSHLLSIAPTGTISFGAGNISSGIEPVFSYEYNRDIKTEDGTKTVRVTDYAYRNFGVEGLKADELSVFDHVKVLNLASGLVDSACSKTCNVGPDVTWNEFKDVYMAAFDGGASGCTTFRKDGKRFAILNEIDDGEACYIDPVTGDKSCS